jgi:hypothetical protein
LDTKGPAWDYLNAGETAAIMSVPGTVPAFFPNL